MNKTPPWLRTGVVLMGATMTGNAAEPDKPPPVANAPSVTAEQQVEFTPFATFQFVSGDQADDASPSQGGRLTADPMPERLTDPDQRLAVRAEQRAFLAELYADTEETLLIDSATREKLLDLLVDKQLANFDAFDRTMQRGHPTDQQAQADAETSHLEALRDLLGEDGFDRFQTYKLTLAERGHVNRFNARLDPANQLQTAQKERLIDLLGEQDRELHDSAQPSLHSLVSPQQMPSPDEMQHTSELLTIATNEEIWRRMPKAHQHLIRKAAAFLKPPQLTVLEQLQTERLSSLQQWIERARAHAGLNPTIPVRSDIPLAPPPPSRTPVAGVVKFDFNVQVNRSEPVRIHHVGANGKSVTFEAGDGLFIEATPTLYDDHWLEVRTTYYEQSRNGTRRRISSGNYGTLTQSSDGTALGGGGGTSIVIGAKAYSIMETATATL